MVNFGCLPTQLGDPLGLGRTDLTGEKIAVSREIKKKKKKFIFPACIPLFSWIDEFRTIISLQKLRSSLLPLHST